MKGRYRGSVYALFFITAMAASALVIALYALMRSAPSQSALSALSAPSARAAPSEQAAPAARAEPGLDDERARWAPPPFGHHQPRQFHRQFDEYQYQRDRQVPLAVSIVDSIDPPTQPIRAAPGAPSRYIQIGLLRGDDGAVLPLYGRGAPYQRSRMQYFTKVASQGMVAVSVAVQHKNRSCTESLGCEELYSGDTVTVPDVTGDKTYAVTVYETSFT